MSHEAAYQKLAEKAELAIDQWLPPADTRPTLLHQAMRASMASGGKRLRPALTLAAASMHPALADAGPAAAAVECLHAYTLIHDDLPAIDNSDLRRGRPTCHKQFGEPAAILAGDALLTHSFWILSEAYRQLPQIAAELTRILADAAGSQKLIGGQMEDILGEGRDLAADELDYIHLNKTAALIEASLAMGMRLTEAPESAISQMSEAGRCMGLAFQIVDDILDATGDAETLGKTVGQDAANDKNTYVKLHGLEASRAKAAELTNRAIKAMQAIDADTAFLQTLARNLLSRVA